MQHSEQHVDPSSNLDDRQAGKAVLYHIEIFVWKPDALPSWKFRLKTSRAKRDLEWNLKDLLEHSVGMLEHLARIFVTCFQTSAFGTRRLDKKLWS